MQGNVDFEQKCFYTERSVNMHVHLCKKCTWKSSHMYSVCSPKLLGISDYFVCVHVCTPELSMYMTLKHDCFVSSPTIAEACLLALKMP